MTNMSYPLRIRFWYLVHTKAESLWHWVWREKLSPWHEAERAKAPIIPDRYTLLSEVDVPEAERTNGVVKRRIYSVTRGNAAPPPPLEGPITYSIKFAHADGTEIDAPVTGT